MPEIPTERPIHLGRAKSNPAGADTPTDVVKKRIPISLEEGLIIVSTAETWAGTPYEVIGAASRKNIKGDCSGSTYYIYKEAGFPYGAYKNTGSFHSYVNNKNESHFIKIDTVNEAQPGDILWWEGHMAIFAGEKDENGNNMWTAFNTRTKKPYGKSNYNFWRKGKLPEVYRYLKDVE